MKKIYLFATLALGAMTFSSCNDFLDQKSETELSGENVYNNEYFTSLRINNLYGKLTTDRTYSQDMSVTFGNNTDVECVDGTGTNYNAASYRGWGNYFNASFANDTKSYNMWNEFYGIIEQCNLCIDGIENSELYKSGSRAMKYYLGEAYTLRAMIYLDLVRLWGDVPLKLEKSQDDLSNVFLPKTDRDIILDQMIADLDNVIDNEMLPWAGEHGYTTEHVNLGYALGLQGQICMTRAGYAIREAAKDGYETARNYSDNVYPTQRPAKADRDKYYEKALDAFNKIIASGRHKMEPSFHNYWYTMNQRQYSNETIFEIPMGLNESGEIGYSLGVRLNQQTSTYGYTNSTGHMNMTAKLFYDYGKNDTRRAQTCVFYQIRSTAGSNTTKSGTEKDNFIGNAPFAIACGKWDPRMMTEEWLQINKNAEGKFGYGINFIKLRYPHVLLLYAECLNELAGPDATSYNGKSYSLSPRDALLMVRERAYAGNEAEAQDYVMSIIDKDAFFKALVDENALELAGESVRKWDLIRWNLLADKILETRYATITKEQVTPEGNTVQWDAKVAYNYLDAAKNLIDDSSWTWGENRTSKGSYAELKSTFGTEKADQTTNAMNYCGGLVGIEGGEQPEVKNLYLLPIPAMTISSANGYLQNSYGY